jgi:hypothetical protein
MNIPRNKLEVFAARWNGPARHLAPPHGIRNVNIVSASVEATMSMPP